MYTSPLDHFASGTWAGLLAHEATHRSQSKLVRCSYGTIPGARLVFVWYFLLPYQNSLMPRAGREERKGSIRLPDRRKSPISLPQMPQARGQAAQYNSLVSSVTYSQGQRVNLACNTTPHTVSLRFQYDNCLSHYLDTAPQTRPLPCDRASPPARLVQGRSQGFGKFYSLAENRLLGDNFWDAHDSLSTQRSL